MRLGLLADLRGRLAPLERALSILDDRGCDRLACLGSTAEGGEEDEAVLARLREVDPEVAILPSPHDVHPSIAGGAAEVELAGLALSHECPEHLPLTDKLWITGYEVPSTLVAGERFAAAPEQRACADWFEALVLHAPGPGAAQRRLFLRGGTLELPEGTPFAACPGSVAMSERWERGGSLMIWDDQARTLEGVRFGPDGPLDLGPIRALVYCEEFEPHRPDADALANVELTVKDNADDIGADIASLRPELLLLDYHLAGSLSGLDALLEVRPAGAEPPCPIFTIAGNPADQGSMKDCGALGELPFAYLKDTFSRLLRESGGAA
jgi:hypothetical protein